MKTATFNDITFSYELMQIKTYEFSHVKVYSNVLILDPGNSRLKSCERMNEIFIESKVSFEKNTNCITS
jgi:hypothetical protein